MYALDGPGLKQLCTTYEDWVASDPDKRSITPPPAPIAETHLSEFFLNENYNIHFSAHLGKIPFRMWKEYNDIDCVDDHRSRWYDYTAEQRQTISGFKI